MGTPQRDAWATRNMYQVPGTWYEVLQFDFRTPIFGGKRKTEKHKRRAQGLAGLAHKKCAHGVAQKCMRRRVDL